MADKIITTFQQRREAAQAFEQIALTETEAELLAQVDLLVRSFPPELLLSTLIRNLDTNSSQLRGGLGYLAARLPGEDVAATLRAAAANRRHSPQTRMTAALISERYLGEPVPPALVQDLNGSNDVAFQSLVEAIEEGKRNRHVLLEYVLQMREMGQDVAFMVMDALDRLPAVERPALLRLIAHDARLTVAQRAVDRLIRLAENQEDSPAESSPTASSPTASTPTASTPTASTPTASTPTASMAASRVLHVLEFTLPPRLTETIARANRKLRFAGKGFSPPSTDSWHGLISPADMGGNQTIWCFRRPTGAGAGTGSGAESDTEAATASGALLGLIVNPRLGIVQAFGSETMAGEHLPYTQAVGQMTLVKTDSGENAVLLEASFDFCRTRILAALKATWQCEPKRDLPPEYQLYNDLIWQFGPPQPDPALARYFRAPDVGEKTPGTDSPNGNILDGDTLDAQAAHLLQHPAMSHWRVLNRMLHQLLRRAQPRANQAGYDNSRGDSRDDSPMDLIRLVLRELAERPETAQITEAMVSGLQAQAAWLHMAGDMKAAEAAFNLAQALPGRPAHENPLLAHMVAASIEAQSSPSQ